MNPVADAILRLCDATENFARDIHGTAPSIATTVLREHIAGLAADREIVGYRIGKRIYRPHDVTRIYTSDTSAEEARHDNPAFLPHPEYAWASICSLCGSVVALEWRHVDYQRIHADWHRHIERRT
jgi:hypothetical protein